MITNQTCLQDYDYYTFCQNLFFCIKIMKRILLKLSGEAIKAKSAENYDPEFMDMLTQKIVNLTKQWLQVGIVVGWWNLYRGIQGTNIGITRATGDSMGMVGTVMNGLAIADFLNQKWVDTRVLSAIEISRVCEFFSRAKALHHLRQWRIVVCVAGTGNPYFSTDSGAVQRALELECDMVVKATKVNGIYDKDPAVYKDAVKYPSIAHQQVIEDNLRIMDLTAIAMAKDNNLDMFVCKMEDIDRLGDSDLSFWTVVKS